MDTAAVTGRDGPVGTAPAVPSRESTGTGVPAARRVGQVALALIALQAVFRGWAVLTGFFYEDDFRYVYDAATSGLGADYLLQDYNGHLMPGEFLLVWVLQAVAPMSFTAVGLTLLVLQVGASLAVWALLRELVGPRPGALLPLAVYLFSPLTLGSFLWYAAALQALPLQIVLALSVLLHVRYLRDGRLRDGVGALVVVVVGLVFWEKALLAVPLLAAVTVLFFSAGGPVRRVVSALTSHWRLWTAYAVVCVGYLSLYLSVVEWQLRSRGDRGSTLELVREATLNGFVPALFGGPYTGFPTGLGIAPDPPLAIQLVFLQVLLLLVVGTVLVHRAAWRAWALLVGYLVLDCLLLASGRLDVLGPVIGRDTRYIADASVVAAIALALALFPQEPRPPGRGSSIDLARTLDRPLAVALVLMAFLNSAAITSAEMVRRWADTSAEAYVQTAQADLRRLGAVSVYDGSPPPEVLSPWFLTDHRVSRIIGPLPERPSFDGPTGDLRVVDADGHLRPVDVAVATESVPAADPTCGWPVTGDGATSIRMQQDMYPWKWTVEVAYYSGAATRGTVTLGPTDYPVRFERGLNSLFVVHTGPTDDIRVGVDERDVTVCVGRVSVGQVAQPDAAPE